MIGLLHGKLYSKMNNEIVLDTGGVGYRVFLAPDELAVVNTEDSATLHTYLSVREDALQLYGFLSEERLRFFEKLISINGIGPRIALSITGAISYRDFKEAVLREDLDELQRLPGVGRKVAQKMLLELREKIKSDADMEEAGLQGQDENFTEAKSALVGLGFSASEAERLLSGALKEKGKGASSDELIKHALQHAGGEEA